MEIASPLVRRRRFAVSEEPDVKLASKRYRILCFRGSTQENSLFAIFRFGYGKTLNDKTGPDRAGSGLIFLFRFLLVFSRIAP